MVEPKLTPEEKAILKRAAEIQGRISSSRLSKEERIERARKAGKASGKARRKK